jgi:molybdopterin-guanine dinucleotide biosynthesis protein A
VIALSPFTILLLAGGRSRRMKRDKRLISRPRDQHLLGTVLEAARPLRAPIFLAAADTDAARPCLPGVAVVWDRVAYEGPLRALVDSAGIFDGDLLVLATDWPEMEIGFLRRLLQFAEQAPEVWAVVPEQDGRLQALCALYRAPIWPMLGGMVQAGEESLVAALRSLPSERLARWPVSGEPSLRNWNRPEDRFPESGTV